jgi:hypothetical protein
MFKAVHPDVRGIREVYPERDEPLAGWFDRTGTALTGCIRPMSRPSPDRFGWIVRRVQDETTRMQGLKDGEILPLQRTWTAAPA